MGRPDRDSWLLTPLIGDGPARLVGAAIWTSAFALFVAAVGGYLVASEWWPTVAVVAACVSAAGIVVMWGGIAATSAVFALAVDVVVLIALLWADRLPSGIVRG